MIRDIHLKIKRFKDSSFIKSTVSKMKAKVSRKYHIFILILISNKMDLNFVKFDRLRNLGSSNRCHVYFPRCNESERETKVTKKGGEEARGRKKYRLCCPEFSGCSFTLVKYFSVFRSRCAGLKGHGQGVVEGVDYR